MPPREPELRLTDILERCDRIRELLAGVDREEFLVDGMLQDSVSYNLVIIGEAAANLPLELLDEMPGIPWARVRGLRNLVVHEYFGVDDLRVWETAKDRVPELRSEVQRVLANRYPDVARRYEDEEEP